MVNIKVAVRIRPLSHREVLQGDEIVVRKENKSVVVVNPKIPERQDGDSRQRSRRFSVDFCYDPRDPERCSQEAVYKDIGSEVLDSMLEGYNACVLAYGHSASGKTYTIMGLQDDPGLTPRLCEGLFQSAAKKSSKERITMEVTASFLEIYNEKVKDLLGSEETGAVSSNFPLRVREHPKLGPYVQGLSEHSVTDKGALLDLLTTGNGKRSTAATENNKQSSRSHAVFTIHLRQSDETKCETDKWSKVHLVDLAGSLQEISQQETPADERASSAQSKERLQEGANINKSLVTLGYVISALAESLEANSVPKEHPVSKSWQPFVPYRDSVLTWLLKDTLGGNSNTIMIATISPASGCLSETMNTLRYAKRTKRIVNEAIVNEDPKVRMIRELRKEIERLKGLLVSFQTVTEERCDNREIWQRWIDEGVSRSETMKGGERGREGESLEGWRSRGSVRSHSTASPRGSAVEVNDEKESVVNGSTNDTFSHESEIFSDSLESLGSVFVKRGTSYEAENEAPGEAGRGESNCCETLKSMHRSRPDLIKGISGRLKERLPSTSSQSCADASNLSQSTSENSVTSSGSVEVQSSEGRGGREKDWRSEVIDAVTTRLYLTKNKPELRGKVAGKKENGGGELEELKLCKRARMKLFDLRRKLGMNRKMKRTIDSDTQTDNMTGTIRVKEKCVETDLDGGLDDRALEDYRGHNRQYLKTTRTFAPRATKCAVESGTQTAHEEKSDKSANTSPNELSPRDEECFSDDSLELEHKRVSYAKAERRESCNAGDRSNSEMGIYFSYLRGDNETEKTKVEKLKCEEPPVEQKCFLYASVHPSKNGSVFRKEENLSSDSSITSAEGTEIVSSSEASSEDFVFYENFKEEPEVGATVTRDRELYTITENSEQSDPSEAFSPIQSQNHFVEATEANGTVLKWNQNRGRHSGAKGRTGGRREAEGEEESEGAWKGGEQSGKAKKMKWVDWQSNYEKQYLNLNVSSSNRAPFSIDTHLFGKEWRKEQSTDAMFASADSVTLVLMGPAKPKSSVLMELIKRSLRRNCLSCDTMSTHKKWKSRGVQCDENLVRSVSMDMAMIALSRIAKNQEQPPNFAKATSMGVLDPDGIGTISEEEKGSNDREITCQCQANLNCFNTDKKKSALKCTPGTETVSHQPTIIDDTRQKKCPDIERQKKSVSWSGETIYDVDLKSGTSEDGSDEWQTPLHYSQPVHAGTPPLEINDTKTRFFKPEPSKIPLKAVAALQPTDDLTAFLKEATHLLKKINSNSNETARDIDMDAQTDMQEKKIDKTELLIPRKEDKWLEKEGSEGRINGVGAPSGESNLNSTWPRRRAALGKPPTGMKGRFGRPGNGGRSESVHCNSFMDWTRNCRWNSPKSSAVFPVRNWYAEDLEKRAQSCGLPYGEEDKWDKDVSVRGMTPPRMSAGKVNWESVSEAEKELEKCCRRLELVAEQDELREKILESRKATLFGGECDAYEAGVFGGRWHMEDEYRNMRKEVRKGMKRRKDGVCTGGCSCMASARDPCKHFLRKGSQSSFELDSFGPGSKHCHQMCMFCRKKDAELYSSTLNLNSECLSDVCRLNYYGYCPCSSVRLSHVASSPRAYMQHLLTLRRQIVDRAKVEQLSSSSLRAQFLPCFPYN